MAGPRDVTERVLQRGIGHSDDVIVPGGSGDLDDRTGHTLECVPGSGQIPVEELIGCG